MKTIGMLGGMSWESSALYYNFLNREVKRRLGGQHNARSILYTIDFADADRLMHAGQWNELGTLLADAARRVELAGADLLILCSNTTHRVADAIASAIQIPMIHIADAAGRAISADRHQRAGLLGTRFTMEQPFYRERLADFGIDVVTPETPDRDLLHKVIFEELVMGIVRDESRAAFRRIMSDLEARGADCIILGCTELSMLIDPADTPLKMYDTMAVHALAAVDAALS